MHMPACGPAGLALHQITFGPFFYNLVDGNLPDELFLIGCLADT